MLYEGYFARGKRNGKGLLIKLDCEYVYIGEHFNDYCHGYGTKYLYDINAEHTGYFFQDN